MRRDMAATTTSNKKNEKLLAPTESETGKEAFQFVVQVEDLTLGDFEKLEEFLTMKERGQNPTVKDYYNLFTAFFTNATIEDCRKLKIKDLEAVVQTLVESIGGANPNA